MRVALLTNSTATVSYPVYKRLCEAEGIELVHTFFYDTIAESHRNPLKTIAKFGVRETITKVAALVLSRVGGLIGGACEPRTAYEHARAEGLPHSVIANINDPVHHELIGNLDALVVSNCKNILKKPLLTIEGPRFLNIHSSLLPAYRGPTPIFWAMYHGESHAGISIHEMTPHIDRGGILAQESVPLDYSKSVDDIAMDLYTMSADMIVKVLLEESTYVPTRNDEPGNYFTFPTAAERREFKRRVALHATGKASEITEGCA